MRFLAEAVWYPTLLLPGPHIKWTEVNQHSVRALFRDGDVEISLLFNFSEMNLIDTTYSEARGRTVGGKIVQTPWEGHFWNCKDCAGKKVPVDADVGWVLREGKKPYWRGYIDHISYEWSGDGPIQAQISHCSCSGWGRDVVGWNGFSPLGNANSAV